MKVSNIVPRIEIMMDPTQPVREEKKANIKAPLAVATEERARRGIDSKICR
jgi:hypothetical protein